MTGPVTPVEGYLSRIADSLDRLVAIAEGHPSPDPGTQDPEPTVSKAPAAPRKTAPAKGAKPTARKGH